MSGNKNEKIIWLAPLGDCTHENLTSYWTWCEGTSSIPHRVLLLHDADAAVNREATRHAFEAYHRHMHKHHKTRIEFSRFDEENVDALLQALNDCFKEIKSAKSLAVVDFSPSTWNYIAIGLYHATLRHPRQVAETFCVQYTRHHHRQRPYPLIPRKFLKLIDLSQILPPVKEEKS